MFKSPHSRLKQAPRFIGQERIFVQIQGGSVLLESLKILSHLPASNSVLPFLRRVCYRSTDLTRLSSVITLVFFKQFSNCERYFYSTRVIINGGEKTADALRQDTVVVITPFRPMQLTKYVLYSYEFSKPVLYLTGSLSHYCLSRDFRYESIKNKKLDFVIQLKYFKNNYGIA